MKPAIRAESSGSASHWSRKPIMSVRPDGSGGCEDPRITFVEPLQSLHDDLRGALAHRPTDRLGHIGGFVSLEATGACNLCSV